MPLGWLRNFGSCSVWSGSSSTILPPWGPDPSLILMITSSLALGPSSGVHSAPTINDHHTSLHFQWRVYQTGSFGLLSCYLYFFLLWIFCPLDLLFPCEYPVAPFTLPWEEGQTQLSLETEIGVGWTTTPAGTTAHFRTDGVLGKEKDLFPKKLKIRIARRVLEPNCLVKPRSCAYYVFFFLLQIA